MRLLFLADDGSVARDVLLEPLPLLGSGIAPLGDLDRDGVPDVAVTARESFDDDEDSVLVLFLTRDGRVRRSVELRGQDALRAIGVGADFDLGQGLAALGDLDGDGCPELVVGTRYPEPDGLSFFFAGQTPEERRAREAEVRASAVVLFLDREGGVRRARAIGAFPVGLGDDGWGEPMTFAGVGDVNGDGTPDLAVGKPFTSYGGDFRGAVWIVPLRPDGEPLEGRRIVDLGEGELRCGKQLGRALAAPGDVDGDGVLDLLAAGSNALHVLFLDRDGGLKAHRAVSTEPWNGFKLHDPALACGRPVAQGAGVSLAVGGRRGDWRDDVGVVWLLAIGPDGDLRAR